MRDRLNIRGAFQLSETLALKAVSLLLALILWITILGFKREELRKRIPFSPKVSPNMMITNRPPPYIEFTFSGPRFSLKNLDKRELSIEPDLTRTRETTIPIPISEDLVGDLPRGIRVLRFYPPNLLIRLEELGKALIRVEVGVKGVPAFGYEVVKTYSSPHRVWIGGPKGLLQTLDSIRTKPFDIEGMKESQEALISLDVDASQGLSVVDDKPVFVRVTLGRSKKKVEP